MIDVVDDGIDDGAEDHAESSSIIEMAQRSRGIIRSVYERQQEIKESSSSHVTFLIIQMHRHRSISCVYIIRSARQTASSESHLHHCR